MTKNRVIKCAVHACENSGQDGSADLAEVSKISEQSAAGKPQMITNYGKCEEIRMVQKETANRIIAACGNDCSSCPRYVAHPYEKTAEELLHTAELWMKIGYRDHIVSQEEISCLGCRPENWCRYQVIKCCEEKSIKTCAECAEYPCENLKECFDITKSFEPKCRRVCSGEEYEQLKKAFFEKEKNLSFDRRMTI